MHPFRIQLGLPAVVRLVAPALVLLASTLGRAATYYVDYQSGVDSNAGTTTAAPWKHCPGDPAATGAVAAISLAAGDTVNFKGGVTYILTGSTGVVLRWSGTSGAPITYDGNSTGAWGTGPARFSDQYGANGLAAFSASTAVGQLAFKNLEFTAIGGAALPPPDAGSPVPARYGAGFSFSGGVTNTRIEACVFRGLGYTFNQKPMSAASIRGAGISLRNASGLAILKCQFANVASGIDMQQASSVSNVEIRDCTFSEAMVWPIDLPAASVISNLTVFGCTQTLAQAFSRASWSGYGESPRVLVRTVTAGSSVVLSANFLATPVPTFRWQKNGVPISGATGATFTVSAATAVDAATYTVVATNSAGASTSNEAVLVVQEPVSTNVAPVITTHPVSQTVSASSSVTFTAGASGVPTPTYQWLRNGVALSGATNASLTFASVASTDAGVYALVATNVAGSATSNGATLTVTSPPPTNVAPVITTHPVSQTVAESSSVTFTAGASGVPTPTYQWLRNGVSLSGATNASLTLVSVTTADAGVYSLIATNVAGTASCGGATLTVTVSSSAVAPVITTQPLSQTVPAKSNVTFTVAASGTPAATYQWAKDGAAIAGATSSSLVLRNVNRGHAGIYSAVATNSAGSATSNGATLIVLNSVKRASSEPLAGDEYEPTPSRLTNLSVRSMAGAADDSLIVGFVVRGTGSKSVLLRGAGPSLAEFGVPNVVQNPSLAIYSGATLLDANDDWGSAPRAAQIAEAGSAVGAFALAAQDAALLTSVEPGAYTVQFSSALGTPGAGLVEVYDAARGSETRLVNLSVRTVVRSGDSSIVGFVIDGTEPKSLLVRAAGPTLRAFGVANPAVDPQLEIFRDSIRVEQNDNWGGTTALSAGFREAGAFAFEQPDSRDAAVIFRALPGAYTAVISDTSGAEGVVIVEVYELPEPASP